MYLEVEVSILRALPIMKEKWGCLGKWKTSIRVERMHKNNDPPNKPVGFLLHITSGV